MRVLFIGRSYPPEVNSIAVLYGELAQGLARLGHDVTVLTRRPQLYLAEDEPVDVSTPVVGAAGVSGDITVRRVPTLPVPGRVPVLRGAEQLVTAGTFIADGVLAGKHDVALVYSPPLPYTLTAWVIGMIRRMPFVLNVQDLYPQTAIDLGLLRNRALIGAFRSLERFAYRRAARITVHSEGNRQHVIGQGADPEKVRVIHNWVDTERIAPAPFDNEFRRTHVPPDRFVVSFAGVMGFAQGLERVIEAADLLRAHTDIYFLLIGEGVKRPDLESDAARRGLQNVLFLPLQPSGRYAEVLAASDVCLVTLSADLKTPVVPGKLQSIMAAGRPVIASLNPRGDAATMIEDSGCGIVADPADATTLADAVLRLARDSGLRATMGANGRQFAERRFTLGAAVNGYADELESAARDAGRRRDPTA
ncbi:MAG: glycosyltransferase family 4 protein [Chloroflexi bacterium]|nr:glycosyltransferase family 4 protein [Chloroflexota bacterium]